MLILSVYDLISLAGGGWFGSAVTLQCDGRQTRDHFNRLILAPVGTSCCSICLLTFPHHPHSSSVENMSLGSFEISQARVETITDDSRLDLCPT